MTEPTLSRVRADSRLLQRVAFVGIAAVLATSLQFALSSAVGQIMFMTLGVVILMVLCIVFRAERRVPLVADPLVIVLVFLAQFYVIGAPSLFILNFYVSRPMTPERGVLVLGLFFLLIAAFFIGYQFRLGQILADRLPDFERSRRRMSWIWVETVFVLAGIIGCLILIISKGGVGKMIRASYGQSKETPMFQLAYHTLLAGTFLMWWRVDAREKSSVATWAPLVALIFAEVIFFGFIGGSRKWLFFMFFGLIAIRVLRRGARSLPKMRVAAMFLALLAFFSVWGELRSRPLAQLISGQNRDARASVRGPFYMGYFKSVAEPFETASLVVDVYPSQHPYEHGRTLLVTLLGFIPRSVWPEKPVGIAKSLTRYTDGFLFEEATGHSITPTLVGDFYANFGVVGVLIGGVLFGIACRTVVAYAATGMTAGVQLSATRVLIPAAFVSGLVEIRSDSATLLGFCVMVFVPIVITCATSRLDAGPQTA